MEGLATNILAQLAVLAIVFGAMNWIVFRRSPNLRLVSRVALLALLSISLFMHGVVPFSAAGAGTDKLADIAVSIAKAAWWLVGAACLVGLVRVFLIFERRPREARLLQDLVVAVIYLGAFLSIVSYVFRVPIGTMVATSGVLAIILGLALQSTLSDVFSGIALNIGRPYTVGDWIALDDGTEGRVVETNWRATHLLSATADLVSIPNSALAKMKLTNQSNPDDAHGTSLKIKLVPSTTPSAVVEVMETVLKSANSILKSPSPSIRICSMDARAIELELSFMVSSISATTTAKNELFDLVFRHAKAAGLRLADPGGVDPLLANQMMSGANPHPSTAWRLLNSIPLLAALTEDEKEALSTRMTRRTFRKGAIIAQQGETLTSLLILRSGVVVIERGGVELIRLSPGDWFGEGGLLIGQEETGTSSALTTVVAYEISQEDIASLLKDRPAIADEVGAVLTKRIEDEQRLLSPHRQSKPAGSLASRIRHLFDIQES